MELQEKRDSGGHGKGHAWGGRQRPDCTPGSLGKLLLLAED